jgi:hypothetical protein
MILLFIFLLVSTASSFVPTTTVRHYPCSTRDCTETYTILISARSVCYRHDATFIASRQQRLASKSTNNDDDDENKDTSVIENRNSNNNTSNTNNNPSNNTNRIQLSTEASPTSTTSDKKSDNVSSLINRFITPRIDDPVLPLSDVLVAQIIAPTVQVAWTVWRGAPRPSWLQPLFDSSSSLISARGSLVAPLLIHGAALATCWLLGALAAQAYREEAVAKTPTSSYTGVLITTLQAGAFATGVLILGTQLDLLLEFKRYVQYGESPEVDFRLLLAAVEVVNDVFFEALLLIPWRLWVARQSSREW